VRGLVVECTDRHTDPAYLVSLVRVAGSVTKVLGLSTSFVYVSVPLPFDP
jgi:hypothetical protein